MPELIVTAANAEEFGDEDDSGEDKLCARLYTRRLHTYF